MFQLPDDANRTAAFSQKSIANISTDSEDFKKYLDMIKYVQVC